MAFSARVLLDSVSPLGIRLTTFEVTFPRFVLAEFNTHRAFCLEGDTRLYFDLPCAAKKGETRRFTMTVRDIYEKWHHGAAPRRNRSKLKSCRMVEPDRLYRPSELAEAARYAHYTGIDLLTRRAGIPRIAATGEPYRVRGADYISWVDHEGSNRQPMRDRIRSMHLRSCNEDTGEIGHTRISDVARSGNKPVFRITLTSGQQIMSSRDHLFLTDSGWQRLEDAAGLTLSVGGVATWSKTPRLAVNGVEAYRDPQWLKDRRNEGLSARQIAGLAGVSIDRVKYQFRRYRIPCSNRRAVWYNTHVHPPWNKGVQYCNISTRGVPGKARVRRGPESHLWRGGVTRERKRIGAWTQTQAFRVHKANGFRCVICSSGERLHAHHVDPVAHAPERAMDPANLTTLCHRCHKELHQRNLELVLVDYIELGRPYCEFWNLVGYRVMRKPIFRRPKRTMVRHFVPLKSVEYMGIRETYDIEVDGPFHNFVANGIVVHNSRNSASSRAIPTSKMIERAASEPVIPLEWGRNQKGMSASERLTEEEEQDAKRSWLDARDVAVEQARSLQQLHLHKQVVNRVLEPFLWHTVIVTATEWENFFELRCSPNAQPELRQAAMLMREAMNASKPEKVAQGQWHLPLVQPDERSLDLETQKKISAARCARVSYLTHEGKREIEKDLELYERLKSDRHLSPFEHVATPAEDAKFHANFRGWVQMRNELEKGP